LIVGDGDVGKSSLIVRTAENKFTGKPIDTEEHDQTYLKAFTNLNPPVSLKFIDTLGSEKFRVLTANTYRDAEIVGVAFSVADQISFENIENWLEQADVLCKSWLKVLIGTQCDITDHRVVTKEAIEQASSRYNLRYFETSAKTGEGVEQLFQYVAEQTSARQAELRQEVVLATSSKSSSSSGKRNSKKEATTTTSQSRGCFIL